MPNGGARPGAGRKPGIPNKSKGEVREAAKKHGQDALKRLVYLMDNAKTEQTQFAASKEILDRAYGKSTQPLGNEDEDTPFIVQLIERRVVHSDNRDS